MQDGFEVYRNVDKTNHCKMYRLQKFLEANLSTSKLFGSQNALTSKPFAFNFSS
jgi:hypothetical protein